MISGVSILGIGVEIVEISKIKNVFNNWPNKLGEKLFTENEISYCREFFNSGPHFASIFAAKEAFLKALNIPWEDGMKWTDIEITIRKNGPPIIVTTGKTKEISELLDLSNIFVSFSYSENYAIAQVLITKFEKEVKV